MSGTLEEKPKEQFVKTEEGPTSDLPPWPAGGFDYVTYRPIREKPVEPHTAGDPYPHQIHLIAPELRPGHEVTIRSEADGWECDLKGLYRPFTTWVVASDKVVDEVILYSAWIFEFEGRHYQNAFNFMFCLDGHIWSPVFALEKGLSAGEIFHTPESGSTFGKKVIFDKKPYACFQYGVEGLRLDSTHDTQQRFQSARRQEETFDAVVIGGGFAGGVIANELSNKGKRTLLLEMGTYQFPSHASNFTLGAGYLKMASRQADIARGVSFWEGPHFMLGGRSLFWSGILTRLMDWEMQDIGFWPAEILQALRDNDDGTGYFQQAERLLKANTSGSAYAKAAVKSLNLNLADVDARMMPWAFDSRRDANSILPEEGTGLFNTVELLQNSAHKEDPGHDHLVINMGQMALQLHHDSTGKITSVECFDLVAKEVRHFKAKHFILALGSIESPKLALVSDLMDESKKLGVGLTDHPCFHLGEFQVTEEREPYYMYNGQAKIMLTPNEASRASNPLFGELNINNAYWLRRIADPDLDRATRPATIDVSLTAYSHGLLNDKNRIVAQGRGQRARILYEWYSADPIYGDFNGLRKMMQGFRNKIWAELKIRIDGRQLPENARRATIQHAVGSMRMGKDPRTSCVDTNLRVHGHENLFVADASVFPYAATVKPSLLMTALALRLAHHVEKL